MMDKTFFSYKRKAKTESIISLLMCIMFLLFAILMQVYVPGSKQNRLTFAIPLLSFWGAAGYLLVCEAIPDLRNMSEFRFVIYADRIVCRWPKGRKNSSRSQINFSIKEKHSAWIEKYLIVCVVLVVYLLAGTDFYNNNPILWPCTLFLGGVVSLPAFVSLEHKTVSSNNDFSVQISDIRYIVRTGLEDFHYFITTYDEKTYEIPADYGNPVGKIISKLMQIRPEIKELINECASLED